jgi:hypothetical protein
MHPELAEGLRIEREEREARQEQRRRGAPSAESADHRLAAARAAREASLALDTLAVHLRALSQTPAPPPALTPSLPPDPPPESKSETSQPMQSDGGAGASLPSGWHWDGKTTARYDDLTYVQRSMQLDLGAWWWRNGKWPLVSGSGYAPTALQAMCAALGIEIKRTGDGFSCCDLLMSQDGERHLAYGHPDLCARAALEAHHAQQQALKAQPGTPATAHPRPAGARDTEAHAGAARLALGPSEETGQPTQQVKPADCPVLRAFEADGIVAQAEVEQPAPAPQPECKCWWPNSGKRQATRWCSLHAAEWQTFAEQSAGELDPRERGVHPDGTPRAGCDVCEGGKRS